MHVHNKWLNLINWYCQHWLPCFLTKGRAVRLQSHLILNMLHRILIFAFLFDLSMFIHHFLLILLYNKIKYGIYFYYVLLIKVYTRSNIHYRFKFSFSLFITILFHYGSCIRKIKSIAKTAVTRIWTWVFAATMQSTHHYTITAHRNIVLFNLVINTHMR